MSAGPTAQPSRIPGNIVFDVVPAWTTTSGARLQRLGKVSAAKPSSRYATSSTIRNPYWRASSTSGARLSPERLTPAGFWWSGMRVDELRAQALGKQPLQLVHLEPVLVHRDGDELRLEAPKRLDRAQVGRGFDDDDVAGVEIRLADQLERLDPAARDQQLVVGRTAALQPLEPVCEGVARAGQPTCRRVLERTHLAFGGELLEQRRDALARERLRVGEAAREGDQVGNSEQPQNEGDPLADIATRACRGERVPPSRLGRHRHAANPMPPVDFQASRSSHR